VRWRHAESAHRCCGFRHRSTATVIAACATPDQYRAEKGVSGFIGDGLNRWPAVHRLEAASSLWLMLEKSSGGARYHGVADEGHIDSRDR